MDDFLRIFFAITLDDEIKNLINALIENLKKTFSLPVRWVKDYQLHLTVRFLGHVSATQLEEIYHCVAAMNQLPSFDLSFGNIILFPHNKPRIISIGVKARSELFDLVEFLNDSLNRIGIPPEERPFLPHITLGRILHPKKRVPIIEENLLLPSQPVTQVTLFQSTPSPTQSKYTVLKQFDLNRS